MRYDREPSNEWRGAKRDDDDLIDLDDEFDDADEERHHPPGKPHRFDD